MTSQFFALVRDKNGNPKFDSWNNIDQGLWDMLSEKDKLYVLNQRNKQS